VSEIEITQEDREAAAIFYEEVDRPGCLRSVNARVGRIDHLPTVQAFAAHRQAARERALDEAVEVAESYNADTVQPADGWGAEEALGFENGLDDASSLIATAIRKLKEG